MVHLHVVLNLPRFDKTEIVMHLSLECSECNSSVFGDLNSKDLVPPYEETYTELENYVCPVTNIRNLPPFSRQEECKCRTPLDFDPKPKGHKPLYLKYFSFIYDTLKNIVQ